MRKTNKKQIKTTTKQKILLIILGIFLALVVLELGLRIGGFVVSSYQRASNKEGFDADYRILCLGESTTADLYGNKNFWPAQLEIVLNNKSSKIKFKVFNEGIGGTNTAFILSRLKGNLDKYKPNIVITMMGINDEGLNIKYKETLRVKAYLLFEDLRVYKLSKLLWVAWNNKIQDSNIKDVSIVGESKIIKEEYKEEAEEMLSKAIEINPNNYEAYFELGRIYWEENRYKEAEEMLSKAIEINPNNDNAYFILGRVYWEENRYKEAEEMLSKAIEINPNNDGAYIELGGIYDEQGKIKEAKEIFGKAIEINPNNYEAYAELGRIYCEENSKILYNFRRGNSELGQIYLEENRSKEAEEMLSKAIEINPNNDNAYFILGIVYGGENRYKEAEEMLSKAIEINPNNDNAYFILGRVYWEENRYKEAEEMLSKAIEINPNNVGVYIELGSIYGEQGISNKEIEKFYEKEGFLLDIVENPLYITRYHYKQLYKELNKRGIKYIAMQYPTLDVNELRNMFKGDEDIIFLSNEANFKKVLSESDYWDYFVDNFGKTFGHATLKGNRLIAENVANIILKELGIEESD